MSRLNLDMLREALETTMKKIQDNIDNYTDEQLRIFKLKEQAILEWIEQEQELGEN